MGNTLDVVADRSTSIDDLVAAGELLDMRFHASRSSLSLQAQKLLHDLIKEAGADVVMPKAHRVALRRLNYKQHRSKSALMDIVRELFGVSVELQVTNAKGKKATKIGSLLSDVEQDEDDDGELRYEFSSVLRAVIKNSNHWAVLSRKAVMSFQSRYSLRLYELLSIRVGLSKVTREQFSIEDIRSLFGVPFGKLIRWQDLKTNVLEPSVAEVTHLTGLTVKFEPVKSGRSVIGIVLIWREKDHLARKAAAQELDRSSVGRSVRRQGTAEAVVDQVGSSDMAAALEGLRKLVFRENR